MNKTMIIRCMREIHCGMDGEYLDIKDIEDLKFYGYLLEDKLDEFKEQINEFKEIQKRFNSGQNFTEDEFEHIEMIENAVKDSISNLNSIIEKSHEDIPKYASYQDFTTVYNLQNDIKYSKLVKNDMKIIKEIVFDQISNSKKDFKSLFSLSDVYSPNNAIQEFNEVIENLIRDNENYIEDIKDELKDIEDHFMSQNVKVSN